MLRHQGQPEHGRGEEGQHCCEPDVAGPGQALTHQADGSHPVLVGAPDAVRVVVGIVHADL